MTSNTDNDDVERGIRDIESQLRRIERQSKSGLEDQLFFGICFSLLILFITLPMNEAVLFLENTFSLPNELAVSTANGIRVFGILTSLFASLLRYYGSMCSEHACKTKRLQSIFILLAGFWFFVFIIGQNLLYGVALVTVPVTVPLGAVILAVFYLVMIPLERKMLNFYAQKGLILKSESKPLISPCFLFLCCSFYFMFMATFFASPVQPQVRSLLGLTFLMGPFILMVFLYMRFGKGSHRKGSGNNDSKTIQKKLFQ